MNDEIDLLKYLLTNIKIQQDFLYKILRKKEMKDEIYDLIRYEIFEYRKFAVSLKRMLQNRIKKYNKEKNILLDVASSIGANSNKTDKKEDYLLLLKESAKINLLDIEKIKKEYSIKSKTIIKLIERLESFENNNLNKINAFISTK